MIDVSAIHSAAVDPLDVAARLGLKSRRDGRRGRLFVYCPAHEERTASCSIVHREGRIVWHCFGCGEGGDLLSLVAVVHGLSVGLDFRRVCELAASVVGVALPDDDGPAKPARPRRRQRIDRLALRLDWIASSWLRGGVVRECDELRSADRAELDEAMKLYDAAIAVQVERDRAVDEALERVGDELALARRLDWTPPPPRVAA